MKGMVIVVSTLMMLILCSCAEILYRGMGSLPGGGDVFKILYQNYQQLKAKTHEEADVEMWTETQLRSAEERLPLGGKLEVHVRDITIDAADTEYYSVVVMKDGSEVLRHGGRPSVPYYGALSEMWQNIMIVPIENPIKLPFQVIFK